MVWINSIIAGILVGGLYALFATGLSLAFGVMRFVNLAHGALAVLAAYLVLSWAELVGANYWLSMVLVVIAMARVGYVCRRGIFNFTIGRIPFQASSRRFGIGIVIQNALQEKYTATEKVIQLGDFRTKSIQINDDIAIGMFSLLILVVAIVVLGSLQLFLSRTKLGREFRATADDPKTAQLMGINDKHLYAVAMAIAFAAVALAGFFQGARVPFAPAAGGGLLLFAFEAVVIGGLGSVWGTLLGGIVLGVAQTVANQKWIGSDQLVGHLVFLGVLAFRPNGSARR